MSAYPDSGHDRRVAHADLHEVVRVTFAACGMSQIDAALLAETLVEADLRGVHSHGVLRVPEYVDKLTVGGVDPAGRPRVVKDHGAALVVDGANAMGQVASVFAMNAALARARETGVAVAAVGGSNHCGAMAYYAMMALAEDMIGIATTNALPTMAPWGGIDKIVGINPLAVAIPAGRRPALVLDMAFSGSSHGKIRVYRQKGLSIPEDWAFDRDGRPTTDPALAVEGLLQPIGKFKGVNLAVVTGALATLLSGASYGTELGNMVDGAKPGRDGHLYAVFDIAAFEDPQRVKTRVDGIIDEIHASRRAPGAERIYAPGELEAETAERYRAEGIPLNRETLDAVIAAATACGVDASALGGVR